MHRRQGKPLGERIAHRTERHKNLIHDLAISPGGRNPIAVFHGFQRRREPDKRINDATLVNRLSAFDDPDVIMSARPVEEVLCATVTLAGRGRVPPRTAYWNPHRLFQVQIAEEQRIIDSSDGARTWTTIGVSENIVEASWEALADSIVWGLLHSNATPPAAG